jgi:hypothetical protein
MIDAMSSDGSLIVINNSFSPYSTASNYTGRELDGDVRMNNGNLEVYSGGCWMAINSSVDIQLPDGTQNVLQWARKKMAEEQKLKELCEKYPGLKQAKEKYEIIKALVEND